MVKDWQCRLEQATQHRGACARAYGRAQETCAGCACPAVVPRTSTSLAIEAKMEMLVTVPAAVEEPLASLVVDPAVDPALHVGAVCGGGELLPGAMPSV